MASIETLRRRAELIAGVRQFFDQRNYLSVDPPSLTRTPIPEAHIRPLSTTARFANESTELFLLPSPEYYLKRLLAAGSGDLYTICPSFRDAEPASGQHRLEFTMLEYYTIDADGADSIPMTRDLFGELGLNLPIEILTMDEAWRRWAGFSLAPLAPADIDEHRQATEALAAAALEHGAIGSLQTDGNGTESWEDLFHRILVNAVEPEMPTDRAIILTDYPAAVPTLSRRIPGTPWTDRWELYLGGVEIANCYGEETDAERIREFYEGQSRRIADRDGIAPAVDDQFPDYPLPRCSGVALGIDRLVAAILGERDITRVISFFDFR